MTMSASLEALLRLQEGWQEPHALPEQTEVVATEILQAFRDQAAAVLKAVYAASVSAQDQETPTAKFAGYLSSLEAHFGSDGVRRVAVFHGLSGSTLSESGFVTHADFPGRFALFGDRGFWMKTMLPAYPQLESFSSPQSPVVVSHTPVDPQIESEAQ